MSAPSLHDYHRLVTHIDYAHQYQIRDYLTAHHSSIFSKRLRNKWLMFLAKEQDWAMFLRDYHPTDQTSVECAHLSALYHSNDKAKALASDEMGKVTGGMGGGMGIPGLG